MRSIQMLSVPTQAQCIVCTILGSMMKTGIHKDGLQKATIEISQVFTAGAILNSSAPNSKGGGGGGGKKAFIQNLT